MACGSLRLRRPAGLGSLAPKTGMRERDRVRSAGGGRGMQRCQSGLAELSSRSLSGCDWTMEVWKREAWALPMVREILRTSIQAYLQCNEVAEHRTKSPRASLLMSCEVLSVPARAAVDRYRTTPVGSTLTGTVYWTSDQCEIRGRNRASHSRRTRLRPDGTCLGKVEKMGQMEGAGCRRESALERTSDLPRYE